jgi:GMP synthase PP-ATPase subunit
MTVVGPRAVASTDGTTADFCRFDMFLGEAATRIVNEVKGA